MAILGTNQQNEKKLWLRENFSSEFSEENSASEFFDWQRSLHNPKLSKDNEKIALPQDLKIVYSLQSLPPLLSDLTIGSDFLTGMDKNGQFALWCKGVMPGHIEYDKKGYNGFNTPKVTNDFQRMQPPIVLSLSGYKLTNHLRSFINALACDIEKDNAKYPRNKKRNQKVISEIQRLFRNHDAGNLTIEDINKSHKRINAIYPSILVRTNVGLLLTGVTTGMLLGIGFALAATFFIFWMPYLIPLAILIPITVAGFSGIFAFLKREESKKIREKTDTLITEIINKNQPVEKQEGCINDKDKFENESKPQDEISYIPL